MRRGSDATQTIGVGGGTREPTRTPYLKYIFSMIFLQLANATNAMASAGTDAPDPYGSVGPVSN